MMQSCMVPCLFVSLPLSFQNIFLSTISLQTHQVKVIPSHLSLSYTTSSFKMEQTFNESNQYKGASDSQQIYQQDNQRQQDNIARAEKGEPQVGGSAGREQIGSKDPQGSS